MKKKVFTIVTIVFFCAVAIYFFVDTVLSYTEVQRNSSVIESLKKDSEKIEEEILETRLKMERFRKDPRAAESLLRRKFEMLRKDQYYINDKIN
jgi:hypothetical protein